MTSSFKCHAAQAPDGPTGLAALGLRSAWAAQPLLFGTTPVFLDEQAQFLASWQA